MNKQPENLKTLLLLVILLTFNAAWAGKIKPHVKGTKTKTRHAALAPPPPLPTCVALGSAPTTTQNYVLVNTPRVPITDPTTIGSKTNCQVSQTIQYFDGLGRPMQTVQVKASPQNKDIITPVSYDNYGREVKKYAPYADEAGTANGSFRSTMYADQASFYSTTTSPPPGVVRTAFPFSQNNIEFSPLNRPLEQGAQGSDWQPGKNHTVRMAYGNNDATSLTAGDCRWAHWYTATVNADQSRSLIDNSAYPPQSLYVAITKDENWVSGKTGTTEQYTDRKGHVVLKRVWFNETTPYSTYYVYDDFNNLCFVLPSASGADAALSSTSNQTILDNLCYQYQYDQLGRMSGKKIPGKGWEYTAYNVLDQLVATQDANQRAANQWIYTKYDAQGRVTTTGIWTNNNTAITQAALQTLLTAITTNLWETFVSGTGYNNASWPTTYTTPLTINYYDTYTGIPSFPTTYTAPTGASTQTNGLLTATLTAVLNTPANMLWAVQYYDDLGRNIKTYKQHYLGGTLNVNNYDATISTYDFTNAVTTTTRQHFTSASTTTPLVTVANSIIYDQVGRKLKNWEQITNGTTATTKTLLSQAVYNEIGQVTTKQLHSTDSTTFLQNVAYTYNERGWMLQSTAPLFQEFLQYNASTIGGITPTFQYNGNIATASWGTGAAPSSLGSSVYLYDPLNRLTSGNCSTGYTENNFAYDNMGNMTAMYRYQPGNSTPIDQLSYNYLAGTNRTNQLQTITDASGNNLGLLNGTTTYTYDGNGNLLTSTNPTATQNKTFTYNLLNLPKTATVPTGTITYTYDATGRKLRKVAVLSGVTTSTDYIDGIQYKNSTTAVDFIQTEEGRAVPNGTTAYDYTYYLADHLGNTRITFDTKTGSAVALQKDDYYPFGLEILAATPVPNPKNEYLYNKKELQEELQEYDYGARFYDPVAVRWNSIDPLAEKSRRWSPYNYVENDPIRLTDPDGMCPECEVKVKSPAEGQSYTSTGGATYVYQAQGGWTEQGGELAEVKVHPDGYAQGPHADVANGKAEFGLFRAGFNADGDYAGASGNVSGYEGEAHAKAGDGKVDVGVSADVVKADVSVRLGAKDLNANGKANGSLLSANAGVSGEANFSKNGKTEVTAKAEAGAYAAKGEYTGGVNILGLKIEFTQGGSIGSAHIGASGSAGADLKNKTVGAEASFNIGLGVGVKEGVKIEFHW